jgi:hypothetical protein
MDMNKVARRALAIADALKPLLAGTPVGGIVMAGKAALDLLDDVRHIAETDDVPALNKMRDELEPLVLAHLDRTIAELG